MDGDENTEDSIPFDVKTMNPVHTCMGVTHCGHHQAIAKFIVAEIQAKLVDMPNSTSKDIASEIHHEQAWQNELS